MMSGRQCLGDKTSEMAHQRSFHPLPLMRRLHGGVLPESSLFDGTRLEAARKEAERDRNGPALPLASFAFREIRRPGVFPFSRALAFCRTLWPRYRRYSQPLLFD